MTTDCSATTSPAMPAARGTMSAPVTGAGDEAACAKQAATRARKARNLMAVVASWNRLLTRSPDHCNAAKHASTATAIGLIAGAHDGTRTAANSPMAMVTYPSTAQYVIQSDQPTAKPTVSPK